MLERRFMTKVLVYASIVLLKEDIVWKTWKIQDLAVHLTVKSLVGKATHTVARNGIFFLAGSRSTRASS